MGFYRWTRRTGAHQWKTRPSCPPCSQAATRGCNRSVPQATPISPRYPCSSILCLEGSYRSALYDIQPSYHDPVAHIRAVYAHSHFRRHVQLIDHRLHHVLVCQSSSRPCGVAKPVTYQYAEDNSVGEAYYSTSDSSLLAVV